MIFGKRKQGAESSTGAQIVAWVLLLALLGVLLFAFLMGWGPFKETVKGTTDCTSGVIKGTCVKNSESCQGIPVEGRGCTGDTPVCCTT